MNVLIKNFGDVLTSRPSGKEAILMAESYVFNNLKDSEDIVLDFESVKVLSPSWFDEFFKGLKKSHSNNISFLNTENSSVKATLKTVLNQ